MYAPFVNVAHSTSTYSNTIPAASMPTSTSNPPSVHVHSSYYSLGISDELLCELCNVQVNGLS